MHFQHPECYKKQPQIYLQNEKDTNLADDHHGTKLKDVRNIPWPKTQKPRLPEHTK